MQYRFILAILAVVFPAGRIFASDGWKCGVAKVVITPEKPMWLSGYSSRDKPAQGKVHELWAKALALEDANGKRCVLVTLDLVGIPREVSVAVCAEIQKKHGLLRDAVLLNVSHTHSGPVVGSNLRTMYFLDAEQSGRVEEYTKALQSKIVTLVGDALSGLKPARVEWGTGHATFAVNRRNNKEADVPKLRDQGLLKGPVDHDVPVLAVRDPDGGVKAVAFSYACHATVLPFYEWCGDYPGFAQLAVEKAHPGAVALFWAGCGGDQNPLPRRSVALAEEYGKKLAGAVESVLAAPMTPLEPRFTATYAEMPLAFGDLPSRESLVRDTTAKDKYVAERARLLLKRIEKEGSLSGMYPYPIQTWKLGDALTWIALGGEVVVDYSLRLKRELGKNTTWVAGYSNDVMAYIPSLRVLKEGGYEGGGAMVYYGQPTVWSAKVEETIVRAVHKQSGELQKK
jgi:hypothetical protein